jgi:hypothetical protein
MVGRSTTALCATRAFPPAACRAQGPKVFFDSSKDCAPDDTVRWEGDKLIVELEERYLCGDYQLWVLTPGTRRDSNASFEAAATPLANGGEPEIAGGSDEAAEGEEADGGEADGAAAAAAMLGGTLGGAVGGGGRRPAARPHHHYNRGGRR